MISAILITRNEEQNIRACLESVAWVDEIVVVDSGSSDSTVAICREFTDHVISTDWPGFGPQKNRALDAAGGRWVLSIDADERISEALRDELLAITRDPRSASCWLIPRRSSYCGRMMRHSGWYPDYVLRFFRRECGRFSEDLVHERLVVNCSPGRAQHDILHFPMETLESAVDKMNRYSTLAAREKFLRGERGSMPQAVGRGLWTFLRTYLLLRGFLDGRQGLMLALTNAGGTYLKYAKLSLMGSRGKAG
jgi:glycosyltransferase involved in cell wall biosynthesis